MSYAKHLTHDLAVVYSYHARMSSFQHAALVETINVGHFSLKNCLVAMVTMIKNSQLQYHTVLNSKGDGIATSEDYIEQGRSHKYLSQRWKVTLCMNIHYSYTDRNSQIQNVYVMSLFNPHFLTVSDCVSLTSN